MLQEEQALKILGTDSKLHVLVNYEKTNPNYFYGAYVVSKSWLADHQDVAERRRVAA